MKEKWTKEEREKDGIKHLMIPQQIFPSPQPAIISKQQVGQSRLFFVKRRENMQIL